MYEDLSYDPSDRIRDNQPLTPVANNKIVIADFDPRSPSNGILRFEFFFFTFCKSTTIL